MKIVRPDVAFGELSRLSNPGLRRDASSSRASTTAPMAARTMCKRLRKRALLSMRTMGTNAKTQGDWSAMGDSYAANLSGGLRARVLG